MIKEIDKDTLQFLASCEYGIAVDGEQEEIMHMILYQQPPGKEDWKDAVREINKECDITDASSHMRPATKQEIANFKKELGINVKDIIHQN